MVDDYLREDPARPGLLTLDEAVARLNKMDSTEPLDEVDPDDAIARQNSQVMGLLGMEV